LKPPSIPKAHALVVPAPAKVNLFLHVVGRRPDGYHLIESLFALIDFADRIKLVVRHDGVVARDVPVAGVADEVDLTLRAAKALQAACGSRAGVTISVDKRIPMGAGLGGGSSDAASVLLGLNRLWKLGLSRAELGSVALPLGADVPFFVNGENAFVRGIGEAITPVSLPRQWLALAMPPVSVRTADIFAACELTRCTPSEKISVFSESYGVNDLEPVALSRYAEIGSALEVLKASAPGARMTGSGACVIATCNSADAAHRAMVALPEGVTGRVVRTLARHPLATFA
jgi:4-diphosphocytidyl-2-C-methyl-D-erythritol kinase